MTPAEMTKIRPAKLKRLTTFELSVLDHLCDLLGRSMLVDEEWTVLPNNKVARPVAAKLVRLGLASYQYDKRRLRVTTLGLFGSYNERRCRPAVALPLAEQAR